MAIMLSQQLNLSGGLKYSEFDNLKQEELNIKNIIYNMVFQMKNANFISYIFLSTNPQKNMKLDV